MTMTDLDRLAAAHPDLPSPSAVTGADEREALLQAILSDVRLGRRTDSHRVRTALVGAAAASTLVVGLVTLGPDNTVPRDAGRAVPSPSPPRVVLDHIELAVASAAHGVVHIETDFGNGVLWAIWVDETTGRWRSQSRTVAGEPIFDHQVDSSSQGTNVIVVSYADHAWWAYTAPDERSEAQLFLTPDQIRSQLRDGAMRQVDESRTEIHLRAGPVQKTPTTFTPTVDLWVDASTHLPTRSSAHIEGKPTTTSTYTWLPRSDDNLRNTEVTIPDTFTKLPGAPETVGEAGRG
jgi:hypothetical protein